MDLICKHLICSSIFADFFGIQFPFSTQPLLNLATLPPKMDKRPPSRVPARSKLPTASSSQLVPSASASKRTASTAQLDGEIEHALTRRKAKVEAFSASMAKNSLERRAIEAEQAKRTLEAELAKVKTEKDKVERDRRWFAEREKDIAEERDAERAAFERDKVSMLLKDMSPRLSRRE